MLLRCRNNNYANPVRSSLEGVIYFLMDGNFPSEQLNRWSHLHLLFRSSPFVAHLIFFVKYRKLVSTFRHIGSISLLLFIPYYLFNNWQKYRHQVFVFLLVVNVWFWIVATNEYFIILLLGASDPSQKSFNQAHTHSEAKSASYAAMARAWTLERKAVYKRNFIKQQSAEVPWSIFLQINLNSAPCIWRKSSLLVYISSQISDARSIALHLIVVMKIHVNSTIDREASNCNLFFFSWNVTTLIDRGLILTNGVDSICFLQHYADTYYLS